MYNYAGLDAQTVHEIAQIRLILADLYSREEACPDAIWKMSEGRVTVTIPEYFWWREPFDKESGEPAKRPEVSVYSYAFGPNRTHYFDDATEALAAVKEWAADNPPWHPNRCGCNG